jgi:sigma-B regulation protein RsbU (phosphoserine phosphatase)
MALGVDDACSYRSGSKTGLSAGDVILIGTDGVWETQNSKLEKFGKTRIVKMLKSNRHRNAEDILQAILKALEKFRAGAIQEDDITLLVIKAIEPGHH